MQQNVDRMTMVSAMVCEHDDLEPIVVLDDEPAASWSLSVPAQSYLRSQGVVDPATWAAFRLGAVSEVERTRLLSASQCRQLRSQGIWLPTSDPRTVGTLSGLIRLTPAQHKHAFISAPAGLAAPLDIDQCERVVLVDAPLTAMRLHQAGVRDVAVVEDPAVLAVLRPWLALRRVVLVSHKRSGLAALQAALTGIPAISLLVPAHLGRMAADERATLGLESGALTTVVEPTPAITPVLLREIHDYARGRIAAGVGAEALRNIGANQPDLIAAYRIGYLPADYRSALSRHAQRALAGHRLASALVLPAFDEAGVMVDLFIVHAVAGQRSVAGIRAEPMGLLAPEVSQGCADLLVTDSVTWLFRLFAAGHRNVVMVRGPEDVVHNAERLVRAGVRSITLHARRHAVSCTQRFTAVGITVRDGGSVMAATTREPSAVCAALTPAAMTSDEVRPLACDDYTSVDAHVPVIMTDHPTPVFVEEDRTAEVSIFQVGPLRIAIESRDDGATRRQVVVRAHGQVAQDRFDLAIPAQCARFAGNAARRVGVKAEVVQASLSAVSAAQMAREEAQHRDSRVVVSTTDRAVGVAMLDAQDLIDRIILNTAIAPCQFF